MFAMPMGGAARVLKGTVMENRRILMVPLTVVAFVVVLASAAFACTVVTGNFNVIEVKHADNTTTACGPTANDCVVKPGEEINVEASGIEAGTLFNLHFLNHSRYKDNMPTCMGILGDGNPVGPAFGDRIIGGSHTSSSSGTLGPLWGTIPADAEETQPLTGKAFVCFIESFSNGEPDYEGAASGAYGLTVTF